MLTNRCGFPVLEKDDLMSPVALRELAEMADLKLLAQESEIDFLERPEIIISRLSSPQTYTGVIEFDEDVYISRVGGRTFFGISLHTPWREGIYHIGTSINTYTTGAVDGFWIDLTLIDRRGPRLLNQFSEYSRHDETYNNSGAVALNLSKLVEVHDPGHADIKVYSGMAGTGSIVIQPGSNVWAHRVRGLYDV